MGKEGVGAARGTHEGDAGGRTDGQQRAADPGGEGDQQPLAVRHLRVHGQDREHQRDIVDDGRYDADGDVGEGRTHVDIEGARYELEITDDAEAADGEYDAEKEQQGVPF